MKRLLLVVLAALFLVGCSSNGNVLTGQATHETYNAFSAPEDGFLVTPSTVSATDTAVYKNAWYSVDGASWQSFILAGTPYGTSTTWLSGTATAMLPAALSGPGEHYLIVYTCAYHEGWDCHGTTASTGAWQLQVIDNTGEACGDSACTTGEYCSKGACLLTVAGNTYFVAVDGDDSNTGNLTHPWATFQKAVNTASPGDIAYFRGGTYDQTKTIRLPNGRSGTQASPIRYFNYPGEIPVFDGTNREIGTTTFYCLILQEKSYLHFKGLRFVNFMQSAQEAGEVHCVYDQDSHDITYENMVLENIGGVAFHTHDSYAISYVNCDASDCSDPLSPTAPDGAGGPGNNGVGYRFTSYKIFNSSYAPVAYYGCRAWNASDDGFQGQYAGLVVLDRCWSWDHGYLPRGGGSGFKYGWFTHDVDPLSRLVTHCIAADNKYMGFHENNDESGRPNMLIRNNFAYNNTNGFTSWSYARYPENENIYRNNLGYANRGLDGYASLGYIHDHNSWDLPYSNYHPFKNPPSVNAADFVSLDSSQLSLPRKADGSLPDITFGHLAAGSDLIDRGTDVGLPYSGSAPDLGAFETPYSRESFCGGGSCVDGCGALYTPGETYVLTSDVSSAGTCFSIAAADITLDCDGHRITYSTAGAANTYGIYMNQFNTTIKDCIIVEGNLTSTAADRFGIWLYYSKNSKLINNSVTTKAYRTIYLWQSSDNTLVNNTAASDTNIGVMVLASPNNTLIGNRGLSVTSDGIVIHSSSGNVLSDNFGGSDTGSGLSLMSSSRTSISGQSATGTYGISLRSSSSNVFQDCETITGSAQAVSISADSLGNTFTDCPH